MVWMGSKTNIAEIITLDTTNFQDNIFLAATGELVFLQLNKLSTATVNNVSVWNATPVGRWHLIGGKGIVEPHIAVLSDLAALKALTTANQDRFYVLNSTPPIIYNWDGQSTATADDNLIVKLSSVTTGRMYKIYPSGASTIVSASAPTTVLASGTIYVWAENSSTSYPSDADGRYPDSRISYVSNGTAWLVTGANMIIYSGSPISLEKPPNDIQEIWLDTSSSPSVRYGATINSSSVLSWETI